MPGGVTVRAGDLRLTSSRKPAAGWTLSAGSLAARGPGWRTGSFRLEAGLAPSQEDFEARGTLGLAGQPFVDFALVVDDTGTFARLDLPPTRIGPGGVAPEALFSPLPEAVAKPSGTVAAAAVLALDDGRKERAWLAITDGALELAGVRLSEIRTELAFESLLPPVTLPGQRLAVGRIEAGLPMGPGEVLFELDEGPRLRVRRADLTLAGGRLVVQPFALDPLRPEGVITGRISGVDLARLADELAIAELSATGRLDGEARLRLGPGFELFAEPVRLWARDGGVVRWRGGPAPASADPRLALLYEVLADFHYRRLEAELEGPLAREQRLRLSLEGANPAVYGGHPVALDLRFEGPLGRIVRQGIRGYRLPETLGRRLR